MAAAFVVAGTLGRSLLPLLNPTSEAEKAAGAWPGPKIAASSPLYNPITRERFYWSVIPERTSGVPHFRTCARARQAKIFCAMEIALCEYAVEALFDGVSPDVDLWRTFFCQSYFWDCVRRDWRIEDIFASVRRRERSNTTYVLICATSRFPIGLPFDYVPDEARGLVGGALALKALKMDALYRTQPVKFPGCGDPKVLEDREKNRIQKRESRERIEKRKEEASEEKVEEEREKKKRRRAPEATASEDDETSSPEAASPATPAAAAAQETDLSPYLLTEADVPLDGTKKDLQRAQDKVFKAIHDGLQDGRLERKDLSRIPFTVVRRDFGWIAQWDQHIGVAGLEAAIGPDEWYQFCREEEEKNRRREAGEEEEDE